MRTTKVIEKHVERQTVVDSVTCDCCGATTKRMTSVFGEAVWSDENWQSKTASLMFQEMTDGEGLYTDGDWPDICFDCAMWITEQVKSGKLKRPPTAPQ